MEEAKPKPCPFCGWPATAMINAGTKVWRVYCNDDGTCGDDAPGCGAEGPEATTEAEAIAAWNTRALTLPSEEEIAGLVMKSGEDGTWDDLSAIGKLPYLESARAILDLIEKKVG